MILRASQGRSDRQIARELGTDPGTVARWRRRFLVQRVAGIDREAPRAGRPSTMSPTRIRELVLMTLGRQPPGGGPWSARSLAQASGVSKSTIQRIWKAHHIEPRRAAQTLRRNPGPKFVDKVTDLVGVYFNPPDRAMAFSVDERGRGAPRPPLARRALERFEEDRRALEFRAFLQAIDRETPPQLDLHLLLDGRLAPTRPEVQRWLAHHPRIFLHFLPIDREGPSVIDRWWAGFSRSRARADAPPGVVRLRRAFRDHFADPRGGTRAFVWTATSEEIRGGSSISAPARRPATSRRSTSRRSRSTTSRRA